jgi:hypothetical protein
MSDWIVVPSLKKLLAEFNEVSPNRDKGSDGTIGDTSHQSSGTSDHLPDEDYSALRDKDADKINEVHALDIDSTGPWPDSGWFDRTVKKLIAEEKRRWLDPNDMCRLHYIIWNRYIYETENDFAARPYTGTSDPHTGHAHFSARYETRAENDTRPWGVAGEDLPVDQSTFNKLMDGWAGTDNGQRLIGNACWNHMEENPDSTANPKEDGRMGGWVRMAEQRGRNRYQDLKDDIAEVKTLVTPQPSNG